VAEARIDLLIGERRADFQDTYRPLLLDASGYTVEGVQASPQLVVVSVPVRRTAVTRQVGIQPALDEEELDANYELRSIETQPPRHADRRRRCRLRLTRQRDQHDQPLFRFQGTR
jgi:hypothetical protein